MEPAGRRLSRRSEAEADRRNGKHAEKSPPSRIARMKYAYILESVSEVGRFYVGLTDDLRTRHDRRNEGGAPHAAKFRPWRVKTYLAFADEEKAVAFERYLKSGSGRAFARKRL
jgi:predicted GIY-YIG superfamily endonuclease